jgi:hypothetical protein
MTRMTTAESDVFSLGVLLSSMCMLENDVEVRKILLPEAYSEGL